MRELVTAIVLACVVFVASAFVPFVGPAAQDITRSPRASEADDRLPADISPDTRNRLPAIRRDDLDERGKKAYDAAVASASGGLRGVAAIRLHGSGADIRWESPVGRRLSELAIL